MSLKTAKQTYVCKPQDIVAIAENSPVLGMRSAVYGPAHLRITYLCVVVTLFQTTAAD